MHRRQLLALLVVVFVFVLGNQICLGEQASQGVNPEKSQIIESVTNTLSENFDWGFNPGTPLLSPNEVTTCVSIDLELTDTVISEDPGGASEAEGYFELTNCGDEPTVIWLTVGVSFEMVSFIDTSMVLDSILVEVGAGETVSHEFSFGFPPFDATYEICIMARSGADTDEDCEKVVVIGAEYPGMPFNSYGTLVQGTECVLFEPLGSPNVWFQLDDLGTFQVGDEVRVSGMLVSDCESDCPDANGCIIDNTIDDVPEDPGKPFQECGLIVMGENDCMLFKVIDSLFALTDYGGFVVGDSVLVVGTLFTPCDTACTGALGCITVSQISLCGDTPPHIDGCGQLVQGTNCVLFNLSDTLYSLENLGDFEVGDYVSVRGDYSEEPDPGCTDADAGIVNNTVDTCGGDPGVQYNACGTLIQGVECILFVPFNAPQLKYLLDNTGDFQPGDEVCVNGTLYSNMGTVCIEESGIVLNNAIEAYNEPVYVAGCGELVQGTVCVLFSFDNTLFSLIDYGGFDVGDSVYVAGQRGIALDTPCVDDNYSILNTVIRECDAGNPDPEFHGCGQIVQGTNCLLFSYSNDLYALENTDGLQVGENVCFSGYLGSDCSNFDCPDAVGCILENTVDTVYGGNNTESSTITSLQNYPNPFNPSTTIQFSLAQPARVSLRIYNILGQEVQVLQDGAELSAGEHSVTWNGTDRAGRKVGSGIYFYRLEAGTVTATKKMLLMK